MFGASRPADIQGYIILPQRIIDILWQQGFEWLLFTVEFFLQGCIFESLDSRWLGKSSCSHLERQLLHTKLGQVDRLWRRLLQMIRILINQNVLLIENLILKKLASPIRWCSSTAFKLFLICFGYLFLLKFLELLIADPSFLLQGIQWRQIYVIYAKQGLTAWLLLE